MPESGERIGSRCPPCGTNDAASATAMTSAVAAMNDVTSMVPTLPITLASNRGDADCRGEAERDADRRQAQATTHEALHHVHTARADGEADADLLRALPHRVCDQPVDPSADSAMVIAPNITSALAAIS